MQVIGGERLPRRINRKPRFRVHHLENIGAVPRPYSCLVSGHCTRLCLALVWCHILCYLGSAALLSGRGATVIDNHPRHTLPRFTGLALDIIKAKGVRLTNIGPEVLWGSCTFIVVWLWDTTAPCRDCGTTLTTTVLQPCTCLLWFSENGMIDVLLILPYCRVAVSPGSALPTTVAPTVVNAEGVRVR
jgi:hypothetical protein